MELRVEAFPEYYFKIKREYRLQPIPSVQIVDEEEEKGKEREREREKEKEKEKERERERQRQKEREHERQRQRSFLSENDLSKPWTTLWDEAQKRGKLLNVVIRCGGKYAFARIEKKLPWKKYLRVSPYEEVSANEYQIGTLCIIPKADVIGAIALTEDGKCFDEEKKRIHKLCVRDAEMRHNAERMKEVGEDCDFEEGEFEENDLVCNLMLTRS